MEIYLDNSATTPLCEEAKQAVNMALDSAFGNPSAVHAKGVAAKKLVDEARRDVASALSVSPEEIYFSHSGTLANNTAIFGAVSAKRKQGNRIVTTATEHPSVLRCMEALEQQGFEVVRLSPTASGGFDPAQLAAALNRQTILVSTMLVNNETGAINPVEYLAGAVKRAGAPALIHVDAIQGFGKLAFKPRRLGVDLVSVSGHKLHAPKGVGALYVRKGAHIKNYVFGGGQEENLFSGTENVPGILGFGAAVRALPDVNQSLAEMRIRKTEMLTMLRAIPAVKINSPKDGLPYIVNLSVTGIPSQVLINYLSNQGIYVSAGSACKRGHRSDVLTKMGLDPRRIDSAIRVSMSRYTTAGDVRVFCREVQNAVREIRTKL